MRIFRTKQQILALLEEQHKSNLSVKAFCERSGISSATFFNWRKRFADHAGQSFGGFASLHVTNQMPASGPRLFAEVAGVKIYQFVDATYLKELVG